MTYKKIQEKYLDNGINDFKLKNLDDLKKVHGVDFESIRGVDSLSLLKFEMFKCFLINFFNAQGLAERNTIQPLSVRFVDDSVNGGYLRFDYKINARKTWLHVKSNSEWY